MDTENYSLVLAFPDESESFVLGFEAGCIWKILEIGGKSFSATVHTKNLEVLRRMAVHYGLIMDSETTDIPEWTTVEFKVRPPLRVVEKAP